MGIKENRYKRLTIEQLRKFKGFENYTDEEAEEAIKTLEELSIVFFNLFHEQRKKGQVLTLIKCDHEQGEQRTAA